MLRHLLKDQKDQKKVSKIRQICVQTTAGPEIRGRVSQQMQKASASATYLQRISHLEISK